MPSRQPPGRRRYSTSQHLYAFHVNGVPFDVSGNGHVMAFMSLQRILVVNRQDLVIAVSDHDSGGAAFDAFLGAGCGTQPFTVWDLPMSSADTTATIRNSKERAKQITSSFFMTEFLEFWAALSRGL
jgi:hypothetical protein